jgi:hypothetical protein
MASPWGLFLPIEKTYRETFSPSGLGLQLSQPDSSQGLGIHPSRQRHSFGPVGVGIPIRSPGLDPAITLELPANDSQQSPQGAGGLHARTAAGGRARLLAVLLDLAHTCSRGQDPLALIPPLPQRELAAMAGLSRETTSRTFAQLRQRGMVIGDPQGMRIADLQPLRKRGLLA